ncbi:hypothetical protein RKE25_22100 (plasmid) [Dyella sp. BiH032]|uniref:hypothetical protein n=1 Tax=Dyella sp. BiH032 TaxID=3075430 RepID=UPI0028936A60|nr:hypothetical protein [Dyella sp. BiH032]WNL48424.1 hypothetical protein RKE25_22100 [Dyella sp. BiH032]
MWIREPSGITSQPDERFFTGDGATLIEFQRLRVEAALQLAAAIPAQEAIAEACEFVKEQAGITLSSDQLLAIYSLYPYERGRLADGQWGDTDVRDDALDVVAHFFLQSRWPMGKDNVDIDVFVTRLQRVAAMFGY